MTIEEQFGLTPEGEAQEVVNEQPEIDSEQQEEFEADVEAEHDAEDEGEDTPSDEAENETVEPKRSKNSPVTRIKQLAADLKTMKAEMAERDRREQQLAWQLEQERLANQKLLGLAKDPEPEEEVLDTVLEAKQGSKIAALEQKLIDQSIETELTLVRSQTPEILDAHYHLITALVNQSAVKAKAAGYQVTPEQLYNYAKDQIDSEMRVVKQRGGSVAEFIYQAAQANGFAVKGASKKQQSVVNMKEVNRLREEAGAPAIQQQAFKTGAADAIKQKIRAENKEKGIDESRSAMFGL